MGFVRSTTPLTVATSSPTRIPTRSEPAEGSLRPKEMNNGLTMVGGLMNDEEGREKIGGKGPDGQDRLSRRQEFERDDEMVDTCMIPLCRRFRLFNPPGGFLMLSLGRGWVGV